VKALRQSLARLLLGAHLLRLAELAMPEESVVILRNGAMVALKIDGKLIVRRRRPVQ
jgi:hypothetical protein